ncbi:MAG: hypothetical protein GF317_06670 [Candidatus Lokiarchaeota archaeon]|nr:hypothetical protein [Candidatus Lokiarchaeota archaeon]MBD3199397.1 hypothetical protein [Candidatus Lokiarchaeota archaeon]
MIVIFIDEIEDFVNFLNKRVMNEIFYEFKEVNKHKDLSTKVDVEIVLHFLSKVEEFLVLYETKVVITKLSNSNIDEQVIKELQKIFTKVNSSLTLVKGKIREIFLSYSS